MDLPTHIPVAPPPGRSPVIRVVAGVIRFVLLGWALNVVAAAVAWGHILLTKEYDELRPELRLALLGTAISVAIPYMHYGMLMGVLGAWVAGMDDSDAWESPQEPFEDV